MVKKQENKPVIPRSIDAHTGIALLQKQIGKAEEMLKNRPLKNSDQDAWDNTTKDYLIRTFGSHSQNINAVIHASSDISPNAGMSHAEWEEYEASKLQNKIKMLKSCIEQLETEIQLSSTEAPAQPATSAMPSSNEVFIVHGHDEGAKEAVSRFIEKLGLSPVILHEKPNKGRTLIEKFTDYSNVTFAIVLLTSDDVGKSKNEQGEAKLRARQNVIFELGYFLGKLGRSKVCALYEAGVEIPSDYDGVAFVPLDKAGTWRFNLVKELRGAGFSVDANKIFS